MKAIGSEEDCEEVRQAFLNEACKLNRQWLAELTQDTVPSPKAVKWLLSALKKSADKVGFTVDHLRDAVAKFAQATEVDLLPDLVSGLNELLDQPPLIERRFCEVSEIFEWLMKPAALSVERLIRERHPAALEQQALSVIRKVRTAQKYGTDAIRREKFGFADLVPEWPELNRTLFWHEMEEARIGLDRKRNEPLQEFWRAPIFGSFWRFGKSDFDYVAEQVAAQPLGDNRLVALSLAFKLYVDNDRPRRWRERLKALVASNDELSSRLDEYLNPPPQAEEDRRENQQEASWNKRARERERRLAKYHTNWKRWLTKNLDKIRDLGVSNPNRISNAHVYLHEQMREGDGNETRWTEGDWKSLIDEFGEAVARAFRDGTVAYWRRYKPILRSEGAPANQTPLAVILGLTGLSIEARETADWPKSLTDEEAHLACRYASHELNGFPTWLPNLYEKYPKLVAKFLLKEIKYELSIERANFETHYILSDVSWTGEWLGNYLVDVPRAMK